MEHAHGAEHTGILPPHCPPSAAWCRKGLPGTLPPFSALALLFEEDIFHSTTSVFALSFSLYVEPLR